MKKDYINTINIYRQLGKKYLKDIKNGEPKTISDFLNQLKPKSLILDVGCAGGRDAKIFTKAEHQVIGIDIVEEFLKEAKKNVPKAKFKKMDLMNLKFPDNNFDAIWAMAVLLHFSKTDGKKIIKSFYEILKPDGYLHIGLKRGGGEKNVKEKLSNNQNRYFVFYYKYEIEKILKDCSFKIIESSIITDRLGRKNVQWISVIAQKIIKTC
ncbi:hypothetical protein A2331_04635 [Candidatus Falkowbacteria bacterium RIFOXYB2_FULL_34_18]|uniref:CheR-type methyltransferase domain-containing protein n=1 Tax=Candidatus Falkowbacteria bacterium RIFOXYD2_FULL_34_120 TaxID=1798007 RepID=A0A1F5TQ50_9BACT|nr:MAG: hypothetical protein A2331_04635 [Candidatus Falkowbacteria bacterium RIFOXYB2_FULL_34_18]OGF29352.1 MAG: hypothetical protein A2500_06220 [Candidatus Falkowbacteria bacterium RIFOXYC12_FULL_34_55]OGF36543.1 MAG: hypothetical protein A2466_07260 [Candidatus Falkowbacteria bacterium RIFOXYC2_FULL_34_220]OGF38775.1 MAG: hypothetical protein A2515_03370 [Candidatus Falkowbacteria bacterium RIFOXYD12_FULL_34_57]OGF41016.1 MAG: hypothetical protein A2531_03615 [Candidatus Falkowbacteria bact